jgi:hexokinase
VAKLAADAGLFTEAFAERVRARQDLSAADVSEFMRKFADGDAAARRDADRRMLFDLYDGLCDRAAKLVAIAVAAAMWQSGGCELEPVFLVAEGSSFKKGHRFRERFERMLAEGAGAGFAYDLVLAENHTLIGAAVATHL